MISQKLLCGRNAILQEFFIFHLITRGGIFREIRKIQLY
nr:MAG TPA: hypothetical protein [Bacteriophage sp.]